MSVLRIATGQNAVRRFGAAEDATPSVKLVGFLDKVTKWMPADVLTIYGAAIIAMQPKPVPESQQPRRHQCRAMGRLF